MAGAWTASSLPHRGEAPDVPRETTRAVDDGMRSGGRRPRERRVRADLPRVRHPTAPNFPRLPPARRRVRVVRQGAGAGQQARSPGAWTARSREAAHSCRTGSTPALPGAAVSRGTRPGRCVAGASTTRPACGCRGVPRGSGTNGWPCVGNSGRGAAFPQARMERRPDPDVSPRATGLRAADLGLEQGYGSVVPAARPRTLRRPRSLTRERSGM